MKLTFIKTRTKEDKLCIYLLIGFIVLITAYLVSMYLWVKGLWDIPFAELKVKHGVETGIWAASAKVIFKWSKKNIFGRG